MLSLQTWVCLIIDEEQRFGVEVKERLKALRATVDVLTMTATPIPRTLHMSLLGVRAISNLETPPADRLAVETRVTRFSEELTAARDHARAQPWRADLFRPQSHSRYSGGGDAAERVLCPRRGSISATGRWPRASWKR